MLVNYRIQNEGPGFLPSTRFARFKSSSDFMKRMACLISFQDGVADWCWSQKGGDAGMHPSIHSFICCFVSNLIRLGVFRWNMPAGQSQ